MIHEHQRRVVWQRAEAALAALLMEQGIPEKAAHTICAVELWRQAPSGIRTTMTTYASTVMDSLITEIQRINQAGSDSEVLETEWTAPPR